jgi:hypothetical protein
MVRKEIVKRIGWRSRRFGEILKTIDSLFRQKREVALTIAQTAASGTPEI